MPNHPDFSELFPARLPPLRPMPLTHDFKETIQARIESDPAHRGELLREGVECLLAGELETGKAILRDYINATIGFEKLSAASPASRQRA